MDDLKIEEMSFRTVYEDDEIHIKVNGQSFIQKYQVSAIGKDVDYHRERARQFGRHLSIIGEEIQRQAEFGKPMTIIQYGHKRVFF